MNTEKTPLIIGIDPDTDKSGYAVWDSWGKRYLKINALPFWNLIDDLDSYKEGMIHVIIEAGWLLKKSNWHTSVNQSKQVGEAIAKNVGANHQIGKLLELYCKGMEIEYTLQMPKGKMKVETFRNITKWQGKVNQDMIDAAMLVFGI